MFAILVKLFKVGTTPTQAKTGLVVKTAVKCGAVYGKGKR